MQLRMSDQEAWLHCSNDEVFQLLFQENFVSMFQFFVTKLASWFHYYFGSLLTITMASNLRQSPIANSLFATIPSFFLLRSFLTLLYKTVAHFLLVSFPVSTYLLALQVKFSHNLQVVMVCILWRLYYNIFLVSSCPKSPQP